MIEQEKIAEWIDRYNTHDLPEDDEKQFHEMVVMHPVLQAEVRLDHDLNTLLSDEDCLDLLRVLGKVRSAKQRPFPGLKYFHLAASFLILVSIGIYGFLFLNSKEKIHLIPGEYTLPFSGHHSGNGSITGFLNLKKSPGCITPVTRRESMKYRRLLARYQPLPELELLIGATLRTDFIYLKSPHPRLNLPSGSTVVFEWNCGKNCSEISLEILDNTGKLLSAIYPLSGGSYLLNTTMFGKGLIYWKMVSDEEIIAFGCVTLM